MAPVLAPRGLRTLNGFLTRAEVAAGMKRGRGCMNRTVWDPCDDDPGVFSGVTVDLSDSSGQVVLIGTTDGGPSQDCAAMDAAGVPVHEPCGYGAPVPRFSPTLSRVEVDKRSGKTLITAVCYLRGEHGEPITGLPNTPADGRLNSGYCHKRMRYDESGVDIEDMQQIPGTRLCLGVEEHSPSVLVFDCNFDDGERCGRVLRRYTPRGLRLPWADYPVHDSLPSAFRHRRIHRGFESAAVSPDGTRAFTVLQSAMGNAKGSQKDSHVMLAAILDISDPLQGRVLSTHLYLARDVATWADDSNTAADLKLSAAFWVSDRLGLPASDPVVLVLEHANSQVFVYVADFRGASDVSDDIGKDPLFFDSLGDYRNTTAKLAEMGVWPASKRLLFNSGDVRSPGATMIDGLPRGALFSDKQEGVAPLNDCVLAMGNDNDFGVGGDGPSVLSILQLPVCLSELIQTERVSGVQAVQV